MTEAPPEAPAQEPGQQDPPADPPKDSGTDWQAEARKWEQRAKDNKKAADELEKQRKATMTESERMAAEAEQRGRQTALQEVGQRLARSEIRSVAAESGAELGGVFDYLDLSRFVGEDGEPDAKAIKGFVEALPKRVPETGSLDLGQRGAPAASQDFNAVLRRAAGRA